MARILNLETSAALCSVAWTENGNTQIFKEISKPNAHSAELASMVSNIIAESATTPEAIAVSIGPGSYTGLRIGLSLAKGLAFRMNIPLIAIPTLKIIASGFQQQTKVSTDSILVPMTDARRMEVYIAMYDLSLNELLKPQPCILDEKTIKIFSIQNKYCIFGNGASKSESFFEGPNFTFYNGSFISAQYMNQISHEMYIKGQFADIAYQTPEYLKEFQALTSKKDFLRQGTTFDKQDKKR